MSNSLTLKWLGQSGFLLQTDNTVIACDLYLSDFCQKKSKLDHTRMMPIPVKPEGLDNIDHYLITHGHIDHFDPETVGPLLESNIATAFWCPPACESVIKEYFPEQEKRFESIPSGMMQMLADSISLVAIPAAHEELEKDENGEYLCFSYLVLIETVNKAVFFGGDTMPYPEQADMIKQHLPEGYELVMILPVNGRDEKRAALGFKGNLTAREAIELANSCQADTFVPCHYGMFALNDIPETVEEELFEQFDGKVQIPDINVEVKL